jgi:uncharacterized SAM-binding protein YcdF (DUF218 family)
MVVPLLFGPTSALLLSLLPLEDWGLGWLHRSNSDGLVLLCFLVDDILVVIGVSETVFITSVVLIDGVGLILAYMYTPPSTAALESWFC